MKIISNIKEVQEQVRSWRREGETVALVPTMGFLHEGHLSLTRIACNSASKTIVSIFVNPTQFSPDEDYEDYPRDFSRDEELCRRENVDFVFYPPVEEMYPEDFSTWVEEKDLSGRLCGRSRPHHFSGVTTVVSKLFNICIPDTAVFGQKDAQQAIIIERMVRDLNFPVNIMLGPIIREEDGLALSSRNIYLTEDQRCRALSLSRGLNNAAEAFSKGQNDAEKLKGIVLNELQEAGVSVDYVELVSRENLKPLNIVNCPALLAVAAYVGNTRLIDNCFLNE